MKPFAFVLFAAASAASLVRAAAEPAIVSAMKLADARNYGWVSDITDDARSYSIEGKTNLEDKKDLSLVTMPLIAGRGRGPSRAGSGSSSQQAQATAVFKGDEKYVVETPDGWKKSDDLANDSRYSRRPYYSGPGGYGGYRGPGGFGNHGPMRSGESRGSGSTRAYSNLQPTLSRPHEEIAIIVAGYTDLKPEADGASGTLSETNAKLLLVHAGQKDIIPLHASGTFRLWIKDGELVRYEVKLDGKLSVTTRDGRREVDVHQTATTTLREVNNTTFDVPEAARKKLGV
jgi:hypothetical protein